MTRVHVYGPPADEHMANDERACDDRDIEGAIVIFHLLAREWADGEWFCPCCGFSSDDTRALRTLQ